MELPSTQRPTVPGHGGSQEQGGETYCARAWWVTGAGWGGSSPKSALADSLQLCGSWCIYCFYQSQDSPASCLMMLLDQLEAWTLGSTATDNSAMSLGRGPSCNSAHWE